jgi:hypothetical protein
LVDELLPLVRSSLDFAAQLENARKPKRPVEVQTEPADAQSGPVTTVRGLPKLKNEEAISFTVADRTLWVGSDPSLVRDAGQAANRASPPSTRLAKPGALAYVNLAAVRTMLTTSPPTASALGKLLKVEPAEGVHKLAELLTVLNLADTLVINGGADAQGFSCAWRLATSEEKKAD